MAVAIALALVFVGERVAGGHEAEDVVLGSFEVPIDDVVGEMIAGFNDLLFAVTNGERVVYVGRFIAKRTSSVDGRVRVNFDATAYELQSKGRWNASVQIEFSLVAYGVRLRGDGITVRRIHIYDLPKSVGNDELEYNPDAVFAVKGRLRPSKELVSDSLRIVDSKLTTDDTVRILWENAK